MNNTQILLSDFFRHNVRCDSGYDHGVGEMVWMHPPVHRVLGWITKFSSLSLKRNVWSLNQFKGINFKEVYVKGKPAESDLVILEKFPTLINANILNKSGSKLARIVDLIFDYKTGKISSYLLSRSNPKIPGTSRWSLTLNHINDQNPGMVSTDILSLDDLPIVKSSIKEEMLKKSKGLRNQFQQITDIAGQKLEGWLEESPWEEENKLESLRYQEGNWVDDDYENYGKFRNSDRKYGYQEDSSNIKKDYDPWI